MKMIGNHQERVVRAQGCGDRFASDGNTVGFASFGQADYGNIVIEAITDIEAFTIMTEDRSCGAMPNGNPPPFLGSPKVNGRNRA
jgi:hypothetical protein